MQPRKIACPSCGVSLRVPPEAQDCLVRCSKCSQKFRVPKASSPADDVVTSWLQEGASLKNVDDDLLDGPPPDISGSTVELMMTDTHLDTLPPPSATAEEPLRLVKFGGSGAIFEFAASRLREVPFRCAMPRRCLRCGGRAHLLAHLIIYSGQMVDNMSLEAEHAAGELRINEDQLRNLQPDEMLQRLPLVPNVPPPANLPMPYWVCDMCSGAGLISGQIEVNSETGNGWCRLRVRNLRRSLEFMETAGGKDSKAFRLLQDHLQSMAENPWEQLPSVIQHRVEQWYKPALGEQFMAYVPDRDHTRTEDGMSGLLISNRRLIYHARLRHCEAVKDQPLKFQISSSASKMVLKLEAPSWNLKHLVLDRDGANLLRRSLTLGGFKSIWQ